MRIRPIDRVTQQRDQSGRRCDLPQSPRRQRVKEGVGCAFAGDHVWRERRRKVPEIPIESTFVAVCNEMELLFRRGGHLMMGTEIGMQRRRAAALRADNDKIWLRNRSVTGAWGGRFYLDSSPHPS